MSVAENCALFRRFIEQGVSRMVEEGAIDFDSPLFEEAIHEDVLLPADMTGPGTGREQFKNGLQQHLGSFEMRLEVEDIFGEGDKVVARLLVSGKHVGPFMGAPATNRSFQIDEMIIARFRDGKIAQFWRVADFFSMQIQTGIEFDFAALAATPAG